MHPSYQSLVRPLPTLVFPVGQHNVINSGKQTWFISDLYAPSCSIAQFLPAWRGREFSSSSLEEYVYPYDRPLCFFSPCAFGISTHLLYVPSTSSRYFFYLVLRILSYIFNLCAAHTYYSSSLYTLYYLLYLNTIYTHNTHLENIPQHLSTLPTNIIHRVLLMYCLQQYPLLLLTTTQKIPTNSYNSIHYCLLQPTTTPTATKYST